MEDWPYDSSGGEGMVVPGAVVTPYAQNRPVGPENYPAVERFGAWLEGVDPYSNQYAYETQFEPAEVRGARKARWKRQGSRAFDLSAVVFVIGLVLGIGVAYWYFVGRKKAKNASGTSGGGAW